MSCPLDSTWGAWPGENTKSLMRSLPFIIETMSCVVGTDVVGADVCGAEASVAVFVICLAISFDVNNGLLSSRQEAGCDDPIPVLGTRSNADAIV